MGIFIELKSSGVVAEIPAEGRIFTNDTYPSELSHVRIQLNSARSLASIKQAVRKLEAIAEIKEKE